MLAYEDIILSIATKTAAGKFAFNLGNTCYSKDFPKVHCTNVWDHLCSKFYPNTAMTSEIMHIFGNSKLNSAEKDPDVWMIYPEALRQIIDKIGLEGRMNEMEFMIHELNNLSEV